MSTEMFWTMGVKPPPGYAPRDVLAVTAMLLDGELGQFDGAPALRLGKAVIVAQADDFSDFLSTMPVALDIHNVSPVEAEAVAARVAAELSSHDGWEADPDPAVYEQKRHPVGG